MPDKPKAKPKGVKGKVIKPTANSKTKVFTQQTMREEQLKKKKKPSKGSTGYSGVARI